MSMLVRFYPAAWRARYAAEFEMLLEERAPSLRDRLDIVVGAIDARLQPQLGNAVPALRIATPTDRWIAGFAVAAGVSLGVWSWVMAYAAPRWDDPLSIAADVASAASVGGTLGMLAAVAALILLAMRYADVLSPVGILGAIGTALGLFLGSAGAGVLAIVVLAGSSLALAPSLGSRVASWPIALGFAAAAVLLSIGMYAYAAGGGQDPRWLWLLAAYGPAWVALGLSLRHGGPAPVVVAPIRA